MLNSILILIIIGLNKVQSTRAARGCLLTICRTVFKMLLLCHSAYIERHIKKIIINDERGLMGRIIGMSLRSEANLGMGDIIWFRKVEKFKDRCNQHCYIEITVNRQIFERIVSNIMIHMSLRFFNFEDVMDNNSSNFRKWSGGVIKKLLTIYNTREVAVADKLVGVRSELQRIRSCWKFYLISSK